MMTVIRTDPCGPAESGINTVRAYGMSEEGMTAPEGAGFLEGITLRHPYGMSMVTVTSSVSITTRNPQFRRSMEIRTILSPPTGTVPNLPGK